MIKKICKIISIPVLIAIIYFLMAIGFALNYCHWHPIRFEITGFNLWYNDLDAYKDQNNPHSRHILNSPDLAKKYDKIHLLILSFYVRNDNLSQEIEFSIYPFGIRSYYGYMHGKGD